MGGHSKSLSGQSGRKNPLLRIHQAIVHPPALLTDEVLVLFYHRLETLDAIQGQHLQFSLSYQLLKIPIDRARLMLGMTPRTFS